MQSMIQSLPAGVVAVAVLFALAMSAVLVFAGVRARRQARLVTASPAEPIGMATAGYRRFEGTTVALNGHPLTAPLTDSPCVWFEARVEEWKRMTGSGSRKSEWHTVFAETSQAPIELRDSTGSCFVIVDGAEVTARDKSRWTGATAEPNDRNPPRLGPQESWPALEVAGTASSRYRYTEYRIYAGDPLVVTGVFDKNDREVSAGGQGQPLVIAATSAATHAYMSEMGAQAAFMVALVPLGIAALILLARWG